MNVADGLEMGRRLKARGFEATTDPALADVVLVNTCTVRQHAEDKALSRLGRLADWRAGGRRLLVMAGGAAERQWQVATALQCAEMCGIGHGLMPAKIIVEESGAHAAWISEHTPALASAR